MLLPFECHAGLSGTSVFGKVPATSQSTQAKQKTADRRRLGNGFEIELHISLGSRVDVNVINQASEPGSPR
jgi:hypothetical protein